MFARVSTPTPSAGHRFRDAAGYRKTRRRRLRRRAAGGSRASVSASGRRSAGRAYRRAQRREMNSQEQRSALRAAVYRGGRTGCRAPAATRRGRPRRRPPTRRRRRQHRHPAARRQSPPTPVAATCSHPGSEAGTGMLTWPTSSATAQRQYCGTCPSTSRSWPASSKATRSTRAAASTSPTGEIWPQAAIDYALETGEEDEDSADDPERDLEGWAKAPPPEAPYLCSLMVVTSIDTRNPCKRRASAPSGKPGEAQLCQPIAAGW
jgi:hypothetical protein